MELSKEYLNTSLTSSTLCIFFCFHFACRANRKPIFTSQWQAYNSPDSKVHGVNMGLIWGRQDAGPHVGPMKNLIWEPFTMLVVITLCHDDQITGIDAGKYARLSQNTSIEMGMCFPRPMNIPQNKTNRLIICIFSAISARTWLLLSCHVTLHGFDLLT